MNLNIADITNLIITITSTSFGTVFLILFIILLKNPEKADKWASNLSRFFSFLGKKVEKVYISRDIQSKLNSYGKETNKECADLIPYKTEVKFIDFGKDRTEEEEKKVIIIMRNRKNQNENLIRATLLGIKKLLIPNSRRYIDPHLIKSIDLQFIKNFISSKDKIKLNYYMDYFLIPELENDRELAQKINILGNLTEKGIFTRILLRELRNYGLKFHSKIARSTNFEETKNFYDILKKVAKKRRGEDINPTYNGKDIKMSIVMIGRSEKVFTLTGEIDISPYMNWIFTCEDQGIGSIYLLGAIKTIEAVDKISKLLEKMPDRFEKCSESIYNVNIENKTFPAICMHYSILKNI